MTYLQSHR